MHVFRSSQRHTFPTYSRCPQFPVSHLSLCLPFFGNRMNELSTRTSNSVILFTCRLACYAILSFIVSDLPCNLLSTLPSPFLAIVSLMQTANNQSSDKPFILQLTPKMRNYLNTTSNNCVHRMSICNHPVNNMLVITTQSLIVPCSS